MDDETERLMAAMARRASARPGFIGHTIARWEGRTLLHAGDVLGLSPNEMNQLAVTPLPETPQSLDAVVRHFDVHPPTVAHILTE